MYYSICAHVVIDCALVLSGISGEEMYLLRTQRLQVEFRRRYLFLLLRIVIKNFLPKDVSDTLHHACRRGFWVPFFERYGCFRRFFGYCAKCLTNNRQLLYSLSAGNVASRTLTETEQNPTFLTEGHYPETHEY